MAEHEVDARAVTPPREESGRPGVVTAAVAVWAVLGVLLLGVAILFALALVMPSASEPGTSVLAVLGAVVLLAAAGVGTIVAARLLLHGSRRARVALTVLGLVLSVVGLVQVTFLGVGGVWFVAFVAGVALLHLPAARGFFAGDGPGSGPSSAGDGRGARP